MSKFVLLLTAFVCVGHLPAARAENAAFDSTRIQLTVAQNVAERLKARLVDPETSPKDRVGVQRKLDVVEAQITELSRRLNEPKKSAAKGTAHAQSTSAQPAEPPTPPREPRTYVLSGGLVGARELRSVHILGVEGDRTVVAKALSDTLQANDTIRSVKSRDILLGTLEYSFEDVLITTRLFGKKERAVTVLELAGDFAIVADGWYMYRADTIRTVRISSLERAGRIDDALDCKLLLGAP